MLYLNSFDREGGLLRSDTVIVQMCQEIGVSAVTTAIEQVPRERSDAATLRPRGASPFTPPSGGSAEEEEEDADIGHIT
jgi:hypothetical protein